MMANVIATVLYNTQVSQTRLEKLSSDLSELSLALAGGREMHDVLDRVVETMMRVLGAEAASLFLVDETGQQVVVQAAAGYQKPLVDSKATYQLGEGVTGWIAKEGHVVPSQYPGGAAQPSRLEGQTQAGLRWSRAEFIPGVATARHGPFQWERQSHRRSKDRGHRPFARPSRGSTSPTKMSCWLR